MFRRIFIICIGTLILMTGIAQASIRITEIAWMGTAESQFGEWFELYNDGSDSVNLAGWKLYEDGGSQIVFTLSKTILSKGYLLVERTTASSPDPVPGIDDESGPFAGSGFSNTGEYLVLKDDQGSTIQSLDFSSGWPAGEADTKKTMQWDGTKWITATATPKAPAVAGSGDSSSSEPKSSGTAWSIPKSEPRIEFSLPENIYTSVSSDYVVKTFLDYGEAYEGVFLWNMGDGTVYKSSSPQPIKHVYKYPGTYTISFAYYKNPYDQKPYLTRSIERVVVSPGVTFSIIKGEGFQFINTGSNPIDLSGWFIVLPNNSIELPPFTIIGSKKTVIMPFSNFGLREAPSTAILQTPERTKVSSVESITTKSYSNVLQKEPSVNRESIFENTQASVVATEISEVPSKTKNYTKIIIFSVVLIVVVSLFIFIEKFMAKRQEE